MNRIRQTIPKMIFYFASMVIVHHATKLNSVVLIPDVRTSYQTANTIPIEYDLDKTSMLFIGGFHKSGQNLLRSILGKFEYNFGLAVEEQKRQRAKIIFLAFSVRKTYFFRKLLNSCASERD
jgi:hypothetical protein